MASGDPARAVWGSEARRACRRRSASRVGTSRPCLRRFRALSRSAWADGRARPSFRAAGGLARRLSERVDEMAARLLPRTRSRPLVDQTEYRRLQRTSANCRRCREGCRILFSGPPSYRSQNGHGAGAARDATDRGHSLAFAHASYFHSSVDSARGSGPRAPSASQPTPQHAPRHTAPCTARSAHAQSHTHTGVQR